jgi:phospholipid/cholesterol/gamma-HCH transport system substrate-binding protein
MPKDLRLELKLGIFVLIGIIVLVFSVLSLRDFRSWQAGYNIFVRFGFLNGVKLGSPVRFRGVDVGEVRGIEIVNEPQTKGSFVKVTCWIKYSVKIPEGSSVWVNTLGILGEKYLEIMPPDEVKSFLEPNAFITGNDPVAMHEMQELTRRIVFDIDRELLNLKTKETTLAKLLYDDKLYKKLESILDDLKELTLDLKLHPWKLFFRPKKK